MTSTPEKRVSTSSRVYDYLKTLPKDRAFTCDEIFAEVKAIHPDITLGGVNGFLSKAAASEHLSAKRIGRNYHYQTVNLEGIRIKGTPTHGSLPGRIVHHTLRVSKSSTPAVIRDALLNIAAVVESIHTPIESFSSEELLKELTRRTKLMSK